MAEIAPRIVVDPNILVGKPVIKGTRVPVEIVIGQLAAGLPVDEVADVYGITREDVLAALAYAASVISLEEIRVTG